MVETAHKLYETFSQGGEPRATTDHDAELIKSILEKMLPMDFVVTREAAKFATEASIHHPHCHSGRHERYAYTAPAGV
jgi:hypothetical protein